MDVLFHAPSLAPISGGGRVVMDWASIALAQGCRVTIATPDGRSPDWYDAAGVSVVRRDRIPDRADLVIATIWWTAWHCDRWQRRGVRAAHLHQGHEALWASSPDDHRVVLAAYRVVPTKICVSRWVAEHCASAARTVHLVPPAVAVPVAAPRRRSPAPIVVGMPYRPDPDKGWDVMEAVAARLRSRGAGLRLRVWGPGAPAALGGRYDDVHEPASDDELIELYDSCDVLLYTSRHDGFPLTPIEAMARRAAVVATVTGGLTEYGVGGRNCLLAPPGDVESLAAAVERLAQDAGLRDRLVERGAETARRYSRERFAASAGRVLTLLVA